MFYEKLFILVLLVLMVASIDAEPITDTEVEQAHWTHTFNQCVHKMQLKGHTVEATMAECRKVAEAEFE